MTTQHDDGGPAFPQPAFTNNNGEVVTPSCYFPDVSGMSLRDWFAGQETLSDYDHPDAWKSYDIALEVVNGAHPDPKTEPLDYFRWECEARAKIKLMRADAMLAARKESVCPPKNTSI